MNLLRSHLNGGTGAAGCTGGTSSALASWYGQVWIQQSYMFTAQASKQCVYLYLYTLFELLLLRSKALTSAAVNSHMPATARDSSLLGSGWVWWPVSSWSSCSPMACTWSCSCAPWTALTTPRVRLSLCPKQSNYSLMSLSLPPPLPFHFSCCDASKTSSFYIPRPLICSWSFSWWCQVITAHLMCQFIKCASWDFISSSSLYILCISIAFWVTVMNDDLSNIESPLSLKYSSATFNLLQLHLCDACTIFIYF